MIGKEATGTVQRDANGTEYYIIRVSKNNTRVIELKTRTEGFLSTVGANLEFVRVGTYSDRTATEPIAPIHKDIDETPRPAWTPPPSLRDNFTEGQLVKCVNPGKLSQYITKDTVLVVTAVNGKTIRAINLGGRTDNRYFRFGPSSLIHTSL